MSGIYTTKIPTLDTLEDVDINPSTLANNDVIQYNSTTREWDNGSFVNPYYLNLGYNKYGTGDRTTITSGTPYYPMGDFTFNSTEYSTQYNTSDFIAGGYWKPSQTGIYLFVAKTQVRSVNDRMDILDLLLLRTPSVGGEENFARVGVRTENTGTADDLFYYSPILTTIIKIDTIGDKFRLEVFARTDGTSDLRLYEDFEYTSVEITKLG
jgi:hypothetical protein